MIQGVSKGAEDLTFHIVMACALFTGNKFTLRYTRMEEWPVMRDAYIMPAIWPLFGTEIRNLRREERHIALTTSVYVSAGKPI